MRMAIAGVLLLFVAVPANAESDLMKVVRFEDRVLTLSLRRSQPIYDVTFQKKAAYYQVPEKSPVVRCLEAGVAKQVPVRVTVEAHSMMIRECSLKK